MVFCCTYGRDDALTDTGDDGGLGRTAHQAFQVGAHGDARLDLQLDAVAGHAVDGGLAAFATGHINDLGIDRGLHRIQHIAAGQINGAGGIERQRNGGLRGIDHRPHHADDVTLGHVMGLKFIGGDFDAGLFGGDARRDDDARIHLAKTHHEELEEIDGRATDQSLKPQLSDQQNRDENNQSKNSRDGVNDPVCRQGIEQLFRLGRGLGSRDSRGDCLSQGGGQGRRKEHGVFQGRLRFGAVV